ncbi:prepilin-type N-terminal cleavage/methylation domain-containing protein [Candidatus Omnitrophota bacterium]
MKRSDKAFTLIEILITMVILLIVITGLLLTFFNCIILNEGNSNTVIAVNDAQFVLEEVKGLAYTHIPVYSPPDFSNLNNEDVDYDYDVGVSVTEVTVTISWNDRLRQRSIELATRFARSQ